MPTDITIKNDYIPRSDCAGADLFVLHQLTNTRRCDEYAVTSAAIYHFRVSRHQTNLSFQRCLLH